MNLEPLKLHPCYKSQIWGGSKLKEKYGKDDAPVITGESWELACLPDGDSLVESGELAGSTLSGLAAIDHDAYWGSQCPKGDFPILVKLIDARKDLSIQVHPSEKTAVAEDGERAKFEIWYIVDADPQSYIYFGMNKYADAQEISWRAQSGTICDILNKVYVHKGDVFSVIPGTIHAIGAGIVIAEIQQSSNTTFRLYDYGRLDADGNPRQLHLKRGADCASTRPVSPESCRSVNGIHTPDFVLTEMFICKYFRAYSVDIKTKIKLNTDGTTFQHILCVDGNGSIEYNNKLYKLDIGNSYFIPAGLGDYTVSGRCRILLTRL